ncbi:hypothetical protein RZS08_57750, partial [Arthrospira platensis SPKY1]|nr:hypothetical protein [Arthrospira platensis SPKY1]
MAVPIIGGSGLGLLSDRGPGAPESWDAGGRRQPSTTQWLSGFMACGQGSMAGGSRVSQRAIP